MQGQQDQTLLLVGQGSLRGSPKNDSFHLVPPSLSAYVLSAAWTQVKVIPKTATSIQERGFLAALAFAPNPSSIEGSHRVFVAYETLSSSASPQGRHSRLPTAAPRHLLQVLSLSPKDCRELSFVPLLSLAPEDHIVVRPFFILPKFFFFPMQRMIPYNDTMTGPSTSWNCSVCSGPFRESRRGNLSLGLS